MAKVPRDGREEKEVAPGEVGSTRTSPEGCIRIRSQV
jgi:hypothetical protein